AAVEGVDPELDALGERAAGLRYEAEDLAGELLRYQERIEAPPGRLEELEERLAAIERLERKHGGSVAAVLAYAERCRLRRDELAGAEVALEEATARLDHARRSLGKLSGAVTKARSAAAPRLAAAVRETLADMATEGASFEIALPPRDAAGPAG